MLVGASITGAMAKVAPEIKTRLLADGTWGDFNLFRKNAQKGGESPAGAMRLAVARYCPDRAGLPSPGHGKGDKDARELAEYPDRSIGGGAGESAGCVMPEMFAGKSCSMPAALDWVIDMLALDPSQVKPEDAPALKAWSIYRMCRQSPSFAEDVLSKAIVRQLPNGAREDETGDGVFDGGAEYDLLAAMEEEGAFPEGGAA